MYKQERPLDKNDKNKGIKNLKNKGIKNVQFCGNISLLSNGGLHARSDKPNKSRKIK